MTRKSKEGRIKEEKGQADARAEAGVEKGKNGKYLQS